MLTPNEFINKKADFKYSVPNTNLIIKAVDIAALDTKSLYIDIFRRGVSNIQIEGDICILSISTELCDFIYYLTPYGITLGML